MTRSDGEFTIAPWRLGFSAGRDARWLISAGLGCSTPNAQYQTDPGTVTVAGSNYREGQSKYRLRAIEFDEQGVRWSNEQRASALAAIRDTPRAPLVIVFIHGWHHNARPNDTDLQSFDRLLAKLAENKAAVGADMVGVYIGWRGLSVPRETDLTGTMRYLSFYSRKNATNRLAGIGLTQTLYDLGNAAHRRGGHAIFVGHSFGGRILEHAIAQGLIGQSSGASGSAAVRPPADLTLLLNPAVGSVERARVETGPAKLGRPNAAHHLTHLAQ